MLSLQRRPTPFKFLSIFSMIQQETVVFHLRLALDIYGTTIFQFTDHYNRGWDENPF